LSHDGLALKLFGHHVANLTQAIEPAKQFGALRPVGQALIQLLPHVTRQPGDLSISNSHKQGRFFGSVVVVRAHPSGWAEWSGQSLSDHYRYIPSFPEEPYVSRSRDFSAETLF